MEFINLESKCIDLESKCIDLESKGIDLEIKGIGSFAPGEKISNEELKRLTGLEFDHEKIQSKIGIYHRHMAKLRQLPLSTADFVEKASLEAIKSANIRPNEIDIIIVATDTPEYISPCTAILLQGRLQGMERSTISFDVNSTCASFTTAFHVAALMLQSSSHYKNALVVGAYNMPAFLRKDDAFGHSIFADGAGAVVLQKSNNGVSKYWGGTHLTDGTQWDYIGIYGGGSKKPISQELLDSNEFGLQSLKPLPGDRNVRLWPIVIRKLLATFHMKPEEVDHYLFTQINKTVIEKVMIELGNLPMEKTTLIMNDYGYTGSACIPMALKSAIDQGRVQRGSKVLTIASGAGLAVGANLFTL